VTGEELRILREKRGRTQAEMAALINSLTGRKYDKAKLSKWEGDKERIPPDVAGLLLMASLEGEPANPSRSAVTVALALQKGGVAKTATSICLAYVLARAGRRVLLVDADSQGNATLHAGVPQNDVVRLTREGRTHYHALTGKAAIADVILETSVPNLSLLPSSIALAVAERELQQDQISPSGFMREMLDPVRADFDFIIIDCAPALGMVTMNALTAADYVLIPCQTEAHAIIGLEHLYDTLTNVRRRANPRLEILGIVPTMYNSRLSQDRASLDDIHQLWGETMPIFDPVPRATIYSQAAAGNRVTLDADPGAPGVETYVTIARHLIDIANRAQGAAHAA